MRGIEESGRDGGIQGIKKVGSLGYLKSLARAEKKKMEWNQMWYLVTAREEENLDLLHCQLEVPPHS